MGKGKGRSNRTYPGEREGNNKDANKKLKAQIRQLLKENKKLSSENKSLSKAWTKTKEYLAKKFDDHTLEDLLTNQKEPIYYEEQDFLDTDQYDNDDTISDEDRVFEHLKDLETRCKKCGETNPEKMRSIDCKIFYMDICGSCGNREKRDKDVGATRIRGA